MTNPSLFWAGFVSGLIVGYGLEAMIMLDLVLTDPPYGIDIAKKRLAQEVMKL